MRMSTRVSLVESLLLIGHSLKEDDLNKQKQKFEGYPHSETHFESIMKISVLVKKSCYLEVLTYGDNIMHHMHRMYQIIL